MKRKAKPWTPQEVKTAWRLRKRNGWTNRQIGEKLGRSAASVSAMVSKTWDYMQYEV